MSVGAFAFMLQLLVYVREKYKNYSSLFSAFEYKLQGAIVFTGYVIQQFYFNIQLKDERNEHTALQTITRVNLGYLYFSETVLNTNQSAYWNFTHRVRTLRGA